MNFLKSNFLKLVRLLISRLTGLEKMLVGKDDINSTKRITSGAPALTPDGVAKRLGHLRRVNIYFQDLDLLKKDLVNSIAVTLNCEMPTKDSGLFFESVDDFKRESLVSMKGLVKKIYGQRIFASVEEVESKEELIDVIERYNSKVFDDGKLRSKVLSSLLATILDVTEGIDQPEFIEMWLSNLKEPMLLSKDSMKIVLHEYYHKFNIGSSPLMSVKRDSENITDEDVEEYKLAMSMLTYTTGYSQIASWLESTGE